ncbi:DUF4019 domain-containing protein [Elusimicrobiota bacterium]
MFIIKRFILMLLISILCNGSGAAKDNNKKNPVFEAKAIGKTETNEIKDKKKKAKKTALKWIKLLDSGKIFTSWEKAGELFRESISLKDWNSQLEKIRKSYGKVIKRELLTVKYYNNLPDVPEGEYVILQFKTCFKNREDVIENIIPQKENQKKWRVAGYSMR